jgi:hypothetical protein
MDLRESECATEIELKSASILCHCIVRDGFESGQLERETNKTKNLLPEAFTFADLRL